MRKPRPLGPSFCCAQCPRFGRVGSFYLADFDILRPVHSLTHKILFPALMSATFCAHCPFSSARMVCILRPAKSLTAKRVFMPFLECVAGNTRHNVRITFLRSIFTWLIWLAIVRKLVWLSGLSLLAVRSFRRYIRAFECQNRSLVGKMILCIYPTLRAIVCPNPA